jgi:hypothetical protein
MVFLEIRGAAGWLSGWVIRRAARLLPEAVRDEREEEWLAEYEHWKDGALGRDFWSLGLLVAAGRIARDEQHALNSASHEWKRRASALDFCFTGHMWAARADRLPSDHDHEML